MDTIHLRTLIFSGKHGADEHEQDQRQSFRISLEIELDLKKAGRSDSLKDTLDWQKIAETVRSVVEGPSFSLMEALAQKIAEAVLADRRVKAVTVTLEKPEAWDNGIPGVTIRRKK